MHVWLVLYMKSSAKKRQTHALQFLIEMKVRTDYRSFLTLIRTCLFHKLTFLLQKANFNRSIQDHIVSLILSLNKKSKKNAHLVSSLTPMPPLTIVGRWAGDIRPRGELRIGLWK